MQMQYYLFIQLTSFDFVSTFCPTTKQSCGVVPLFVCGDVDGTGDVGAFVDSAVATHIFIVFEHSPEQHWREFMHFTNEKRKFRTRSAANSKNPRYSCQYTCTLHTGVIYLPNVHLHNMHYGAVAVVALVLASMERRRARLPVASLIALASWYLGHRNDWPAPQCYWHSAPAFRDSFDSDCCPPHSADRQSGSWRICTNKWGNYSNSIRNDTDTKREQNGPP